MKIPRIMVVCGFGLGSSLILRITLDDVLQEHQIKAETFCTDAETAIGQNYDLVLTSAELAKLFSAVSQPVIVIADFLSPDEVAQKVLPVLSSLS